MHQALKQDVGRHDWRALLGVTLLLACGTGWAAGKAPQSDALARYQQERAVCLNGQSNQDRSTCLREAGAALQEARRGQSASNTDYLANALQRCERLPGSDRGDCVARIQGQGTVSGSVAAGGLYRELVTRVPAPLDASPNSTPTR